MSRIDDILLAIIHDGIMPSPESIVEALLIEVDAKIDGLVNNINTKIPNENIVNNCLSEDSNMVLAAPQGKILLEQILNPNTQIGISEDLAGITRKSFSLKKKNGIVELTFNCVKTNNTVFTERTKIFTLPIGFRPAIWSYFVTCAQTVINGFIDRHVMLLVLSNGDVYIDIITSDCKQVLGSVTFMI